MRRVVGLSLSLLALISLSAAPIEAGGTSKTLATISGIVTDNKDPDGLGRVKVRLPWLSADEESAWARIATLFAGKERGAFFLPEVDDEVLVAFEHGDPRAPYVLGGLWNGKDVPPDTNANGKNDKRLLTSRSGLRILLDDTSGAEKVEIADKNGELTVTIDVAGKKVTLSSGGDVEISAPQGKVAISGQSIALEASGQAGIKASGTLDVQGQTVNIKGQPIVNIN